MVAIPGMVISHVKKFVILSPGKTASSPCRQYNEGTYNPFYDYNI